MTKDTFYFSHDHNARTDPKIKKLLAKHGMQGYGIFWAIVEDLYNNANALQTDYDTIAYDLRTDSELVKSIINDFGLFVFEGDNFGSVSVERRLDERRQLSEKARESAYKRWNKDKPDANAMRTHSEPNAIKERKGKEKKGNSKEFTPPTQEEIIAYFTENGYTKQAALKAFQYYESAKWKDSKGSQVKNWKQKMIGVWFKDENKIKQTEFTPQYPDLEKVFGNIKAKGI